MSDAKSTIRRIADVLKDSFDDLVITGSLIMNKIFDIKVRPEEAVHETEVLSSMFRSTAILTDDVGFLNSLGALNTVRVRGSIVIYVYDLGDVRPFCELMGIPCLEPWDSESLLTATREGRDYSETLETPYIIRLGPWITINDGVKGFGIRRREPTFNKNWGEPMRWGLDRLLSYQARELPKDAVIRAKDTIVTMGSGDGVLFSGSAWSLIKGRISELVNYALVRTLYVNPIPKDSINAKYVVDINDYLASRLGITRLMINDVTNQYNELIMRLKQELFFRSPGDPLMLIEWLISKYVRHGEVPLVVLDTTYTHLVSKEGLLPSFDILLTYFEPNNYDQAIDLVTNPLAAILAISKAGYSYGRSIAIINPCTLIMYQDLLKEIINYRNTNYLLIILIIGDNCKEALNILSKLNIDFKTINYNEEDPLNSLAELLSIINTKGVIVMNVVGSTVRYVYRVINDYCDNCGDCLRINCPAIYMDSNPVINVSKCVGCGICQLVCTRGAIVRYKST
ncbi:MAG: indolepyruvate ferredoxin oxidoreductase subunit alpha [Vulcanisaeta sp. AZ3]